MLKLYFLLLFLFLYERFSLVFSQSEQEQWFVKREYGLQKPYSDDRWNFIGSTILTPAYIRLTSHVQSSTGSIWNNIPCTLHNWEMHVHFKVHGTNPDLFGDGFAIWYTKHKLENGKVFGNRDMFMGLGVFFDTYANQNGPHNHGHPYVSAMINNGTLHYDHDRDGTHTELDGCQSYFRNSKSETFAAIRYQNNKLTVSLDTDGKNAWKQCFTVNNVKLPTGYFFGASAATGDLTDNHDIYSVKVFEISGGGTEGDYSNIEPSAEYFAPPRDHVDDPKLSTFSRLGTWKSFFLVVLASVAVFICGMVGYILYTKSREGTRKRFY